MKFLGSHAPIQKFEEGTPKELAEYLDQLYINMNDHWPANAQIRRQNFETKAADQSEVKMRWNTPQDIAAESPAVVFIHGGGHVAGSVDLYDRVVANYVQRSNVPFLFVEYGLSPQTNGKDQAEQAFEDIIWLRENAGQLGINKDRIAIMGDSAGGGIAAAAAILARDRKIHLARQILIYPMLDYRNSIPDEHIEPFTMVGYQVIKTAWHAVISPDHLSGYDLMIASPALLDKFEDLAPIYISVGDLDYFKVENLEYARKAAEAWVPLEFHLHPGAPHGFELFTPEVPVAERATADHVKGYGQNAFDFTTGSLTFQATGQVITVQDHYFSAGWALAFHPDLFRSYPLVHNITEFEFFSYDVYQGLSLQPQQEESINMLVREIRSLVLPAKRHLIS